MGTTDCTEYTDWKRVMNDAVLTHRVNASILVTHSSSVSICVYLCSSVVQFSFLGSSVGAGIVVTDRTNVGLGTSSGD